MTNFFQAIGLKALGTKLPQETAAQNIGDVYISQSAKDQGILKAYLPRYLYRPPFGYPRSDNVMLQRQLSKNPYIYSITKNLQDEVGYAKWDIKFKEDSERKDDPEIEKLRLRIKHHFQNPNQNKESWSELRKKVVTDLVETDSGVLIKVFNRGGEYSQLFAYDGSSFLVNPDIHGYFGSRAEFIPPLDTSWGVGEERAKPDLIKTYGLIYRDQAAYFQYGTAASASIPIPFGRREVVYIKTNPRTDSPYGRSPISILADIIFNLVYGANFSLDFYMNNNMPEGVLQVLGANPGEIKQIRQRMESTYRVTDEATGFSRRAAYRVPIVPFETKFIPFQMDPKTMQLIEQQKWFYPLCLACFGIPPNAVGLDQGGGLRTGDGDNQLKYYLRKAARPIMENIKYHVDNEIIAEFGKDAYENLEYTWCDYDVNDEIKKQELYQKQIANGIMTPKMIADKEGINYSEVEEFQDKQKEKQMQEQERMQQSPGLEPSEEGDASSLLLQKLKEMREAIDLMESEEVNYTSKDLEAAKSWLKNKKELRSKFGSNYYDFAVQVAKAINRGEDPELIDWGSLADDETLQDQLMNERNWSMVEVKSNQAEISIMAKFKNFESQLLNEIPSIKVNFEKDPENFISQITDGLSPTLMDSKTTEILESAINKNYDSGLESIESQLNMNFTRSDDKLDFLKSYTYENVTNLLEETKQDLRQSLSIGLMNGEPTWKLKKRIKDAIGASENRASMILRTEFQRAEGQGRRDAAEQSGLKLKKWLLVKEDERTSGICKELHDKYGSPEQAIDLNDTFKCTYKKVVIDQQQNPFHPNCRTSVMYELQKSE